MTKLARLSQAVRVRLFKLKNFEMIDSIKKLTKILVMWMFTVVAFVVLAVSVVLVSAQSLVVAVFTSGRKLTKYQKFSG